MEKLKLATEQLQQIDKAFLNSMLSYGVYTGRQWTLEKFDNKVQQEEFITKFLVDSQLNDVTKLNMRKAYEVFLAMFNRETFEPVDIGLPNYSKVQSETYGYKYDFHYKSGDYEALDNLARAGVYRSQNADGTYTLHLAFRGTDPNARPMKDFFSKAYLDMGAYYDSFKPLEKAVLEYAKDPKNNISTLHVSGHSLGGAMVQEFFNSPAVKNCDLKLEGFTYGAPGSRKNFFYMLFPSMYHAIKHQKFTLLAKGAFQFLWTDNHTVDSRITQYKHVGDLIPKVGKVLYKFSGKNIWLKDQASRDFKAQDVLDGQEFVPVYYSSADRQADNMKKMKKMIEGHRLSWLDKSQNFVKRMFNFDFHDMLRYTFNLEHKSKEILKENAEVLVQSPGLMPNLTRFSNFRRSFNFKMDAFQHKDPLTQRLNAKAKVKQAMPGGTTATRLHPVVGIQIEKVRAKYLADELAYLATGIKPPL